MRDERGFRERDNLYLYSFQVARQFLSHDLLRS
jgi:hypothetical protein